MTKYFFSKNCLYMSDPQYSFSENKHYLPLFLSLHDNNLYLDPKSSDHKFKIMINTLPKSGTHLCQKIFENIGLHFVRVFLNWDHMGDYRQMSDEDRIRMRKPHQYFKYPIHRTKRWIKNGQFTHTHMKFGDDIYRKVRGDFKLFLMKRNMRDMIVSHAKQKQRDHKDLSDDPKEMLKMYVKNEGHFAGIL